MSTLNSHNNNNNSSASNTSGTDDRISRTEAEQQLPNNMDETSFSTDDRSVTPKGPSSDGGGVYSMDNENGAQKQMDSPSTQKSFKQQLNLKGSTTVCNNSSSSSSNSSMRTSANSLNSGRNGSHHSTNLPSNNNNSNNSNNNNNIGIVNSSSNSQKLGSRRIFTPQFKLQVLESYRNDSDCKGNQRATARKYNIHRRQIQKWLQCESNLRSSVANLNNQQTNSNNSTTNNNIGTGNVMCNNHRSSSGAAIQHQFHNVEVNSHHHHHHHYHHRLPSTITSTVLASGVSSVTSSTSSSSLEMSSNRHMFLGGCAAAALPPPVQSHRQQDSQQQQQQQQQQQYHHRTPSGLMPLPMTSTSKNTANRQEQEQQSMFAAVGVTTATAGGTSNGCDAPLDTVNATIGNNSSNKAKLNGNPLRPTAVKGGSGAGSSSLQVCQAQSARIPPSLHLSMAPPYELAPPLHSTYPLATKPHTVLGGPHHHHHHSHHPPPPLPPLPHTHAHLTHQKHHYPSYATYYSHLPHQVSTVVGGLGQHHHHTATLPSLPHPPYHATFQPSAFMAPALTSALSHAAAPLVLPTAPTVLHERRYDKDITEKFLQSIPGSLVSTESKFNESNVSLSKLKVESMDYMNNEDKLLSTTSDSKDEKSSLMTLNDSDRSDENNDRIQNHHHTSIRKEMHIDSEHQLESKHNLDARLKRNDGKEFEKTTTTTTTLPIDLSIGHRRNDASMMNSVHMSPTSHHSRRHEFDGYLSTPSTVMGAYNGGQQYYLFPPTGAIASAAAAHSSSFSYFYPIIKDMNVVDLSYRKRKIFANYDPGASESSINSSTPLRSSSELPDKLCKFSNSGDEKSISNNSSGEYTVGDQQQVHQDTSRSHDDINDNNDDNDDNDEDIEIEVDARDDDATITSEDNDGDENGNNAKMEAPVAQQPPKPIKLFKPYLLDDECEETRSSSSNSGSSNSNNNNNNNSHNNSNSSGNSNSNSNSGSNSGSNSNGSNSGSSSRSLAAQQQPLALPPPHPSSYSLDTGTTSFPVGSCLQVGGSPNQLLSQSRANSISPAAAATSAFSPATSIPALSPGSAELHCLKGSPIPSGYESSSSSGHSEISSSSSLSSSGNSTNSGSTVNTKVASAVAAAAAASAASSTASSTNGVLNPVNGGVGSTFLYHNRTYSLNLQVEQLYGDSQTELFQSTDKALQLDRWLKQDIANIPPPSTSSIALYA